MEKIYFATADTDNLSPFKITLAGITYPDPDYAIYRRLSDTYVIEYVVSGEGTVILNGKKHHIQAGDTYILPANSEQKYYSSKTNPWEKKWMNISGLLCEKLISAYGIKDIVLFSSSKVESIFDEFFKILNENNSAERINEIAALSFHKMLQSLSVSNKLTKEDEAAYNAKTFIDGKIHTRITSDEVAKFIGLSVSQLGRIFKKEYKTTVYSYILNRKIETAENLLKNTWLPIKEISEMLSFPDEHYFSNIFKKKRGITPRNYRLKNQPD